MHFVETTQTAENYHYDLSVQTWYWLS